MREAERSDQHELPGAPGISAHDPATAIHLSALAPEGK